MGDTVIAMGDRRSKQRSTSGDSDVFSELGLSASDFEIRSGGGKAFVSGQRIVWMEIRQRSTDRKVSGKIGTTKRGFEKQHDALLRSLLDSFRER